MSQEPKITSKPISKFGVLYVEITHPRNKYMLVRPFFVKTLILRQNINNTYFRLDPNGMLTIKINYCWDGSSVVPDTAAGLRASLVHDTIYQMLKTKLIPYSKAYRKIADKLYYRFCIEDGMSKWRARIRYIGIRIGAWWAAKP